MKKDAGIVIKYLLVLIIIVILVGPGYTQNRTGGVDGYIISESGHPLHDAYVLVSGLNRSDVTDISGYFVINNIPSDTIVIEIRHVGYKTRLLPEIIIPPDVIISLDTLILKTEIFNTSSVVVTANRQARSSAEISGSVNIIQAESIRRQNAVTAAEALREEPGLFVQKTNHGGGSAIIRGLSSNQILLLIDGIRLNNSTYRLGNHQYLTTIDPLIVEQIEVLRGPGSVLYGSDALGGTINLITNDPTLFVQNFKSDLKILGRYATADAEKTGRAQINLAYQALALRAGFSFKDMADLRRGANSSNPKISQSTNGAIQSPSGFTTYSSDLKILFGISSVQKLSFGFQHLHQSDVPRYDKYENNGYYRWNYDPQIRSLVYFKYDHILRSGLLDRYAVTLSWQQQTEGRIIQQRAEQLRIREKDVVGTVGFSIQGVGHADGHLYSFGTDMYRDEISSKRREGTLSVRGRYPNRSTYLSAGLFFHDTMQLSQDIQINLGIRYSYSKPQFNLSQNNIGLQNVLLDFSSVTGNLGVLVHMNRTTDFRLNIAQGFRAPNLSDLAKLGESKGTIYEIPNPDLDPERLLSFESGIDWHPGNFRLQTTVYYSHISDILTSADDEFNGSTIVVIDSTEFRIKSKQNFGQAFIWGIENQIRYQLTRRLELSGNLTYTYGQNKTFKEPVGGIPPLNGTIQLTWQAAQYYLIIRSRFANKQARLSSDDHDDPRIPTGGTPGWSIFSVSAGYLINSKFQLRVSLENLFDLNYREHGSGINGPGRNFVLGLEAGF